MKWIYTIIKQIAAMKNLMKNAKIVWYYDQGDEDMHELGLILKSLVECPFFIIETTGMERQPEDPLIHESF